MIGYSSIYIVFIYFLLFLFLLPPLILRYIANWRILRKAGEKGWKALIPFYGSYMKFKIVWDKNAYWFFLIFYLLCGVSFVMMRSRENLTDLPVWLILYVLTYLVCLYFYVILQIHLAKAFGQSGGFAVGLIFLNIIFICILGFCRSEYIGVQPLRAEKHSDTKYQQNA